MPPWPWHRLEYAQTHRKPLTRGLSIARANQRATQPLLQPSTPPNTEPFPSHSLHDLKEGRRYGTCA